MNLQGLTTQGRQMSSAIHASEPNNENSGNWRISAFLLEITVGGYVFTGVVFLVELLYSWSQKFRDKTSVTKFIW